MPAPPHWIFTVRFVHRRAVVGPASISTVEAALHLAEVPEAIRAEIRSCALVRKFIEGRVDPDSGGYACRQAHGSSADDGSCFWAVCVGSVHATLP